MAAWCPWWVIVEGETDVAEFEGLGAQGGCFTRGVCAKKFTRPHQEEEAHDGEMVDVCVEGAFRGVVEIKVGVQGVDEAETDGVGTGWARRSVACQGRTR